MLCNVSRVCCCLLGLLLLAPLAQAQRVDHHPPYVDQHFNLDHSPRYSYGAQLTYSDYYDNVPCSCGTCGTCAAGYGNGTNGRGQRRRDCPPVTTAKLQLWVPDCCEVFINRQRTKPQTLAGVHKGSRIFELAGLDTEPFIPYCLIQVIYNGEVYSRTIPVAVGGDYKVRFHHGFNLTPPIVDMGDAQDAPTAL